MSTILTLACWLALSLLGLKATWNVVVLLIVWRRTRRGEERIAGVSFMVALELVLLALAVFFAWSTGGAGPGVRTVAVVGATMLVVSWLLTAVVAKLLDPAEGPGPD